MGNIPLPALSVRPPEQPDIVGQYGNLLRLKGLQQAQQLQAQQGQIQAQQLQQQQIATQQAQQGQKDQIAFRSLIADPSNQGKTIGEIADLAAKNNAISPQAWQQAKKLDVEQRTSLATLDEKSLANAKAAHDQTQLLFNNVMNMPDDKLAANWASIANQYDAIPGNNKAQLDPNQPMTKDQLKQFGPMLSMSNSYLDQELARRKEQADIAAKQETVAGEQAFRQTFGVPKGSSDSAMHVANYLKANKLEPTAENILSAQNDYIQKTKIAPAQVRLEGLMNLPIEVADPNHPGETVMVPRSQAAGMTGKGSASMQAIKGEQRYMTSGKGAQQLTAFNTAMNHLDVLDKLAGDLNNTDIQVLNKAKQAWATQTGNPVPANFEAAKNAMSGEVASALKASGATDQEIAHVGSTFSNAQSPAQLHGAIETYRTLLKGKRDQLKQQYEAGMQGNPNFGDNGGQGGASQGIQVIRDANGRIIGIK